MKKRSVCRTVIYVIWRSDSKLYIIFFNSYAYEKNALLLDNPNGIIDELQSLRVAFRWIW